MNNPLHILQTFDFHLTKPAEITIFGRAALALGFPNSPAAFANTMDVDAILPFSWLAAEDENIDFWEAQQKTNAELEPSGLALAGARVPEVAEIQALFKTAQSKVLALV